VRGGEHFDALAFSEYVQEYLRESGYSQKELADEIGLHPKVLSRKLHNSGNSHLTHQEISSIVITLATWRVISTQDEVYQLLELARIGPNFFSSEDWQRPPLNQLLARSSYTPISRPSRSSIYFPKNNLPVPGSRLIGREWALERLGKIAEQEEVRLLTLVGTGGSGKSLLALHLARSLIEHFAHGVWYVSLTGVDDPDLVAISIIQTLNVRLSPDMSTKQNLLSYLHERQLMLVLDNFEHLSEARAIIGEMLAAASELKVLVTSRIVLRLYGEYEFSVPPLDVPDTGIEMPVEKLARYGAVQLFVERAKAIYPDFVLTPSNAIGIAQICAMVDGLPLALELAAARVKLLPPDALLKRLSASLLGELIGGPMNVPNRQQTLRNTIDWSFNLLSPVEQEWFPRLGVFVGGWSLEAVEAMIQYIEARYNPMHLPYPELVLLKQLADNSLLIRLPFMGEQVYFTVLYILREYMLEKLSEQGMYEELRDWHASYYLQVVEESEKGLRGPQQLQWLDRLNANRENIRSALEWSLQCAKSGLIINSASGQSEACEEIYVGEQSIPAVEPGKAISALELCLRLAAGLRPYWEWQGYLTEGRQWLGAVLKLPIKQEQRKSILAARAKAMSEASRLACLQNEQGRAIELAEESMALWKQLDDPNGLAMALLHRGWAAHAEGDYEHAKNTYKDGLRLVPPTSDAWVHAQLAFHLAAAEGFTSEFKQMRKYYKHGRELLEQVGDEIALADLLKDQGGLLIIERNYAEAIDCLVSSLKKCFRLGHKQFVATGLGSLSFAVGLYGKPEPCKASIYSAQLGGAAERLMDSIGLTPWTKSNPLAIMARQYIRSHVSEGQWNEAWAEGRALTIEQALDLAYSFA
jgi:predicted ATPase